ncbi:uncharacterized protein LOC135166993 isoform X2 [Diachasmimorpha longicaudata]|uniref:uncharacterized protein LOC135166993 isoform X2 n=1 Tax=Diachasmimorpha longicaudata TaxID=58733 RepID=UPI0030B8E1F3
MATVRLLFCVFLAIFALASSTSESQTAAENIRFVFAKTLCQDHLKSKTAKMIGHRIGEKLCVKPIHCYDPERQVGKVKLPQDTPRDGLICKLAYRAEGRIPYICRKDRCVEAPEYKDRLPVGFML